MPPRPYMLHESNYKQLLDYKPNVAVLPWGATEAHGYHLPYGTDVIEASAFAERAAQIAYEHGAKPIVLPAIPFGNDSQQLDQVATINMSTTTAMHVMRDVAKSLKIQGIDRLLIVNGHGGNEFKPMVRDIQFETGVLIVVVSFWHLNPELRKSIFELPGDHADEMETSILLHLTPQWVQLEQAGKGEHVPFAIEGLKQAGVWTPRPWAKSHPDTGAGDPSRATAAKGQRYFDQVAQSLSHVIISLSKARKGESPYL